MGVSTHFECLHLLCYDNKLFLYSSERSYCSCTSFTITGALLLDQFYRLDGHRCIMLESALRGHMRHVIFVSLITIIVLFRLRSLRKMSRSYETRHHCVDKPTCYFG
ncbi:unnamed protein product [Linum trigynum]|uniref:Uncharacterized protein n=1 Tax=Linum trigynum TaxID=586398 RepID=A0AAV2ESA4_9ROSI